MTNTNNRWLHGQLAQIEALRVGAWDPLIEVERGSQSARIYTPESNEYLITVAVVQKAVKLGATHISFATLWCSASAEAKDYAAQERIWLGPHAATLKKFAKAI